MSDIKISNRYAEQVAERTWRRGILHLTVDGRGLVSLWDHGMPEAESYIELQLTDEQRAAIAATMERGGHTP